MSLVNNNMSPVPFFSSIEERDKWYAYGRQHHLLCDKKLLPFVIRRKKRIEWLGGADADATHENMYITGEGQYVEEHGAVVAHYEITPSRNLRINKTHLYGDGLQVTLYRNHGFWGGIYFNGEAAGALNSENVVFGNTYIEITNLPENIDAVAVCLILFPGLDYSERVYYSAGIPLPVQACIIDSETTSVELEDIEIITAGEYDYIYYMPAADLDVYDGNAHIEVSDEEEIWYSAQLCVGDVSNLLKIEWWDIDSFSPVEGDFLIPYDQGYRNFLYFKTEVCYPSYQYEDEVISRDGYQFPLKQISYKQYKFNVLATEEICDAMRLIHMSDHIVITQGSKVYNANTFLGEVEWQDTYIASVNCEFTTDTIVKKIAKKVNI